MKHAYCSGVQNPETCSSESFGSDRNERVKRGVTDFDGIRPSVAFRKQSKDVPHRPPGSIRSTDRLSGSYFAPSGGIHLQSFRFRPNQAVLSLNGRHGRRRRWPRPRPAGTTPAERRHDAPSAGRPVGSGGVAPGGRRAGARPAGGVRPRQRLPRAGGPQDWPGRAWSPLVTAIVAELGR
jgi:hypothetical protein